MAVLQRKRKAMFFTAVLFLLMFLCMSVRAEAAWKKNSDGKTYSYYSDGKLVKNKWIDGNYYVDAKGIRKTGWLNKSGKWYFFSKTGRLVKNTWIKSGDAMYYAGPKGALYTNGRHKVKEEYFAFSERGVKLTGKRTYNGKTYFFGTKTGRMLKKQWVSQNKKQYYFDEDGVMAKSQWVGQYYVNKSGVRVKNTWKGNRYLGSDGKAVKGIQKIGSDYYYFNPKTCKMVTDVTIKEDGTTYKFGSNGKGEIIGKTKVPATNVNVERTYYTDKYVKDKELLASIIYCEAGNQPYAGQVAVGLVIMNRTKDPRFPDKLREIVYQKQQFAPARDGSLTRALKNPALVTEACHKAAAEVLEKFEDYKKDTKIYLELGEKKISFPYLFFMTKAAYQRLGLTAKYRAIQDHVFFVNWG